MVVSSRAVPAQEVRVLAVAAAAANAALGTGLVAGAENAPVAGALRALHEALVVGRAGFLASGGVLPRHRKNLSSSIGEQRTWHEVPGR